jgi:hypothetical protein
MATFDECGTQSDDCVERGWARWYITTPNPHDPHFNASVVVECHYRYGSRRWGAEMFIGYPDRARTHETRSSEHATRGDAATAAARMLEEGRSLLVLGHRREAETAGIELQEFGDTYGDGADGYRCARWTAVAPPELARAVDAHTIVECVRRPDSTTWRATSCLVLPGSSEPIAEETAHVSRNGAAASAARMVARDRVLLIDALARSRLLFS